MTQSKLIKIVLTVVIIASLIVGLVVYFSLSSSKLTPEALSAQEGADKQAWGYNQRIQDLIELRGYRENTAKNIIDTLLEKVGLPEILAIEETETGLMVKTRNYDCQLFFIGQEIDKVKIGNSLIYRRLAPDKTQIVVEKLYTYQEYDNIVNRIAKSMKMDKEVAAEFYKELTLIDIFDFKNIKKTKTSNKLETAYHGLNVSTPIEVVLKDNKISKVYITGLSLKEIEKILVYDSSIDETQSFKSHTIANAPRTFVPESLAYQVGKEIESEVRFPVALGNGDDSWIMVKLGEDKFYFESNGDITKDGKTTSEKIIAIREGKSDISYLKVGRKEIIK